MVPAPHTTHPDAMTAPRRAGTWKVLGIIGLSFIMAIVLVLRPAGLFGKEA